jgi:hypothetical protein
MGWLNTVPAFNDYPSKYDYTPKNSVILSGVWRAFAPHGVEGSAVVFAFALFARADRQRLSKLLVRLNDLGQRIKVCP